MKGLKYLEILTPSARARPELTVWLYALDAMPELRTLTLHSPTSPRHPPFPSDARHTVSFPSLTRLDISAASGDCALALTHLDLPTLTYLCLTGIANLLSDHSVEELVPYIARHSHGPQDAKPLQSVLILTGSAPTRADILASPCPNSTLRCTNHPSLLATTVPTRLALSFRCHDWPLMEYTAEIRVEILLHRDGGTSP